MKNNNLYNYSTPKSGNEETNFFNIKGRITISAFFLRFFLSIALYYFSRIINNLGIYKKFGLRFENFFETIHLYILPLFLVLFVLIQGAKRVHDVNMSGWNFFIPFYNIFLCLGKGTDGSNDYGIDPKPMTSVTYFDQLVNTKKNKSASTSNSPSIKKLSKFELILGLLGVIIIFLIFLVYNNTNKSNNSENKVTSKSEIKEKKKKIKHKRKKHKKTTFDSNLEKNTTSDSLVDITENTDEILDGEYDKIPRTIDRNYMVLASEDRPVYFYLFPNYNERKNSFFTTQEIVHTDYINNNFIYIEFTNSEGETSKGWLNISDLKLIKNNSNSKK